MSESHTVRSQCLENADLDIIGIAETHLTGNNFLDMNGYVWFGHNRTNLHKKAKKGSGGVGIFVKNHILNSFTVSVLDCEDEGILWINFKPKSKNTTHDINICVCYLPPIESTRNIDASGFFDRLMCQIHSYCKDTMFYICGDFNARCSNFEDFIAGVDQIPERSVVDFSSNKYGELLTEFLIDSNCCIFKWT